jgi:primase-polymerase (primpol)-like protein
MPDGKVQFFSNNHFFTVTGANRFGWPRTMEERTAELEQWHAESFPAKQQQTAVNSPTGGEISLSDSELLDEMFGNPRTGDKIRALWMGDTSGYDSHSNADFALMGWLSSYTNMDAGRMARMFMDSDLYRLEGKAAGYVDLTVNNAIAKTTWIWPGKPQSTVDPQMMADVEAMAGKR